MTSCILHPGNGINYPKKGDYVKINLQMKDPNENILFDCEIRYFTNESNMFSSIRRIYRRNVTFSIIFIRINKR